MEISAFVDLVTESRKRTAIVLINPDRQDFVVDFQAAGLKITELSSVFSETVILSDEAFLKLLYKLADRQATAFLNPEIYLAPRFEEPHFLKYLMPKLLNSEPRKPIFLLFYSRKLFEKLKPFYLNFQQTMDHTFEEDF